MPETNLKILLVEDNPGDARLLVELLLEAGIPAPVHESPSLADALAWLRADPPDLVLLDLSLPDSSGMVTIETVLEEAPSVPVVVLTGFEGPLGVEAVRAGAQDYLVKGQVEPRLLRRSLRYAVERHRNLLHQQQMEQELREARDRLEVRVADQTAHLRAAVDALQNEVQERLSIEQALRESEQRYRHLFELAPIGIAVARPDGTLLSANQSLQRLLAVGEKDLVGRCLGWAMEDPDEHDRLHNKISANGSTLDHEVRFVRSDGSVFFALVNADRIRTGTHQLLLIVVRDITERKQSEMALQMANELLEKIFSSMHVLIAYLDRDFNFLRVNRRYAQADGRDPAFFVGKNHFDLYPDEENEALFRRVVETGKPFYVYERPFQYPHRPESVSYWDWSLVPLKDAQGRVQTLLLTLLDVSERKHLQDLVMQASEQERQRIGQDLHDGLGQNVAGIAFLSSVLTSKLAGRDAPETADARKITEHLNQTVGLTRSLARGLCPVELTSDALMKALRDLSEDAGDMFRIDCRFECLQPVLIDDIQVATHLYRIAQEAISNAHRHGHARNIRIEMTRQQSQVRMVIEDDGEGFTPTGNGHRGMGLRIMEHRARSCGGNFRIDSTPGLGTRVECVVTSECKSASDSRKGS
jgi:PAS domain S-box-containing protein